MAKRSDDPSYIEQKRDPARQARNAKKQKAQQEKYRRDVIGKPEGNFGPPGYDKSLPEDQRKDRDKTD